MLAAIDLFFLISTFVKIFFFVMVVLMTLVAYTGYAERRFAAIIQDRLGPNRVGIPLTKISLATSAALSAARRERRPTVWRRATHGLRLPDHIGPGFDWRLGSSNARRRMDCRTSCSRDVCCERRRHVGPLDQQPLDLNRSSGSRPERRGSLLNPVLLGHVDVR